MINYIDGQPKETCHETKTRKTFADSQSVRTVARSTAVLSRRMLKDRDVLEGFSIQTAEQVCRDLHKLNRIVQSLRNKLGAMVVIPQSELHIDASQTHTLIKLAIMSLCQNSSGLAVEAGARPDCDAEACAMAAECEELVKSLGARFEGDARITPATALRTLAAARRHFGVAVLECIGLGGRSVAAEDELEPRLRRIYEGFRGGAADAISLAELCAAMAVFEVPATDAELRRFLEAAAAGGSGGGVSFAEFHALIVAVLRENGIAVVPRLSTSSAPSQSTMASSGPGAEPGSLDPSRRLERQNSMALRPIRGRTPLSAGQGAPSPTSLAISFTSASSAIEDCRAAVQPALYMFPQRQGTIKAFREPAGRDRSSESAGPGARRRSSILAEASLPTLAAPAYSHLRVGALARGLRGSISAATLRASC